MTLQNAYGDQEFPVRARWRWRKVIALARRKRNSATDKALVFGLTFGAAGILIIALWGMGVLTSSSFVTFMGDPNVFGKFAAVFMAIILIALVMSWVVAFGDAGLPRREQRQYQRLTHAVPLTPRQEQILALDAVSDFGVGCWNRSLEYLPVWNAMPASFKSKHEKNPRYQPFLSFPLTSIDVLRNHLDQSQSIVSTADVQRLSSLTGTSEVALRDLGEGAVGVPAPLLWATDVMFTIGLVRNAYVAEYLTAERAWEHLENLATVAFATFRTADEYWANARIGLALMSNSREAVQKFDTTYRSLKASRWPAASEGFPHNPSEQISDVVRNLRAKTSLPD